MIKIQKKLLILSFRIIHKKNKVLEYLKKLETITGNTSISNIIFFKIYSPYK